MISKRINLSKSLIMKKTVSRSEERSRNWRWLRRAYWRGF